MLHVLVQHRRVHIFCGNVPRALRNRKGNARIRLIFFSPRNSTTSLGFSKRGLPAPSAAKTRGTVKPTADSNWVRARFVNFEIIEKIYESGVRVEDKEAIDEELQKAWCIQRNGLFSTKNVTHMRTHWREQKYCSTYKSL